MTRLPASRMTHSYARIMFVLGAPLTTMFAHRQDAQPDSVKWHCGCRSVGPFGSMVWHSCAVHAHYTDVLTAEKTLTLVSGWSDSAGMHFGDHTATWSFDPANTYCDKQLRDGYLSILHACGTAAGDFFAAELIYRELINNALHHAPGTVSVELEWSARYPVLSVNDNSDLFQWTHELPLNAFNEHGRGLYLVHSFARELHIKDCADGGYKVSVVLPVERKRDLANLFDFPEAGS